MSKTPTGNSRYPVWSFDDCHPDPGALRQFAGEQAFSRREGDYYPGLRAPVPDEYRTWVADLLGAATAAGSNARIKLLDCTFALACDEVDRLVPIQMIPHFDSLEDGLFAAVHYLCEPPFGGTAFYRHRRTGLERIDALHFPVWQQGLVADSRQFGMPERSYPGNSMAAFEQIAAIPLRFGRLIAYPANCLHSGLLDGSVLDHSPEHGRLTITSLLKVEQTAGSEDCR